MLILWTCCNCEMSSWLNLKFLALYFQLLIQYISLQAYPNFGTICRADHNLQDLRSKIFPLKRRKIEALENFPLVTFPAKRKERSLSSLVVNSPQIAAQTSLHGRRTRAAARKAATFCGLSPDIQESIKRMNDKSHDDLPENSSANPNKLDPCRKQAAILFLNFFIPCFTVSKVLYSF